MSAIIKVLAAAAVIAGAVFAVVMYGDKIMATVKKFLGRLGVEPCPFEDEDFVDECDLANDCDLVEEEPTVADQDFEG